MNSALHARLVARVAPHIESGELATPPPTADALATLLASTIETLVRALVPEKRVATAVLDRERLATSWPIVGGYMLEHDTPEAHAMRGALQRVAAAEARQGRRRYWPAEVAPKDVANALERTRDARAKRVAAALRKGLIADARGPEDGLRMASIHENGVEIGETPQPIGSPSAELVRAMAQWPVVPSAIVVAVEQDVREDLRRPAVALDAGHVHHTLVSGMRDIPKDPIKHRGVPTKVENEVGGRIELLVPGKAVQLLLPFDTGWLQAQVIEALRSWRGFEGLRHWAALQRLLSVEGGRSGKVRWKLEDHLTALGYSEWSRRNQETRQRVALEVELLTKIELAVYNKSGELRSRLPVLMPVQKFDRSVGDTWALEGMELQINPYLYRGVRNDQTGELGSNWYPQTPALPSVDHVRNPHALALGLILPMRWRWDLPKERPTRLSGQSLLEAAGIMFASRHAAKAWDTLRRDLEALAALDPPGLGGYTWEEGEAWTLTGICTLHPPQWARDRTVHGLAPLELPPAKWPATGAELVAWRKAKGWSQAKLAEKIGITDRAIREAEKAEAKALGPRMVNALEKQAAAVDESASPEVSPRTPEQDRKLARGPPNRTGS